MMMIRSTTLLAILGNKWGRGIRCRGITILANVGIRSSAHGGCFLRGMMGNLTRELRLPLSGVVRLIIYISGLIGGKIMIIKLPEKRAA
jgi:hypothetical protein